jgi:hypothetical protein
LNKKIIAKQIKSYTEYIIPPDTIGTESTFAISFILAIKALNQRLSIP